MRAIFIPKCDKKIEFPYLFRLKMVLLAYVKTK